MQIKHFKIIGFIMLALNILLFLGTGIKFGLDKQEQVSQESFDITSDWEESEEMKIFKVVNEGRNRGFFNIGIGRDRIDFDSETEPNSGLNDKIPPKNFNAVILKKNLSKEYAGLTITFTTNTNHFKVVVDDKLIYDGGFGFKAAVMMNQGLNTVYVKLPDEINDYNLYVVYQGETEDFRIHSAVVSTREAAVTVAIRNSILNLVCNIIMGAMVMILVVLIVIQVISKQAKTGMLFFLLFGIDALIYFTMDLQVMNMLLADTAFTGVLKNMCLAMMPYLLLMYCQCYIQNNFNKSFCIVNCIAIVNMFIQFGVHLINVSYGNDFIAISKCIILTVAVYMSVILVVSRKQMGTIKFVINLIGIEALVISQLIDCVRVYILGTGRMTTFDRFGTLMFLTIMIGMHISEVAFNYLGKVKENQEFLEEQVAFMEEQNALLAENNELTEKAKKAADAANEAKGRFLANMSHDIRTPINAVIGMNEMILRESHEPVIKGYANDVDSAGKTLLSLVNDILDFSKIESGKMEIIPVEYEVGSLIHDLVNMIIGRAKAKGLEFKVEVDETIPTKLYGDDVRIRQVITNILTNAVKYTHEGEINMRVRLNSIEDIVDEPTENSTSDVKSTGTVESTSEASFHSKYKKRASLHIEVEDTGIGIKKEDISKLFEEFERIEEERNRNIEGTGLGMNITTQLLALMNSKLQVESEYGKGSKFYFDIIQDVVNAEEIGTFVQRINDSQDKKHKYKVSFVAEKARVLVVDDNSMNRKVFKSLLKNTQLKIDDVDSGFAAVDRVMDTPYDIIFLDHMMPEMDGIETLKRINEMKSSVKADPTIDFPNMDTPIVALTANAISGASKMYEDAGFDDYLAKPIIPDKLEKMIKRLLPSEKVSYVETDELIEEDSVGQDDMSNADDAGVVEVDSVSSIGMPGVMPGGAPMGIPGEMPLGLDKVINAATGPIGSIDVSQIKSVKDMPPIEGVFWEYGLEHLGDIKLLVETVQDFIMTSGPDAAKLQDCYDNKDWENYRIKVHAMKSSAAMIGAMTVSGMAKTLEFAARDNNIDTINTVHNIFMGTWKNCTEKLRCLAKNDDDDKEFADKSEIIDYLSVVRNSIDNADVDTADEAMEVIKAYSYPENIKSLIDELSIAEMNIDAEEVNRIIDKIVESW